MSGVLALCLFGLASYLTKKLKGRRAGLIALLVGVAASALLYMAPVSGEIAAWSNAHWMGAIASTFSGWFSEGVPAAGLWSVLCIVGFIVTVVDLKYDHTYNPWAIAALVVSPIAGRVGGGVVVVSLFDLVHSGFGAIVSWAVMGGVV